MDLRPLLDASPISMLVTELETGRMVACNKRFEEEFRIPASECIGRTSLELGMWPDPAERERLKERLRIPPHRAEFETSIRFGDGTLHPLLISCKILEGTSDPTLLILTSQDLGLLREAQDREFDLRERHHLLEANTTEVIARIGLDGKRRYTSPSVVNLLGWTAEELQDSSPFLHFHADDIPRLREVLGRIIATGEPETVAYRSIRKDGSIVWVETSSTPIRNAEGTVVEIHTSSRDITLRHAAEEELRRSEELHRNLFSSLSEGIILLDQTGRVYQANERAHEILNVPAGVLVGVSMLGDAWSFLDEDSNPIPPDDLPGTRTILDHETRRGVVVGVQTPGGLVWISQNSSIIEISPDGATFTLLVSFTDVTARRRTEAALRESEARLRLVADMSVDMISRHALDSSYLWASSASVALLGRDPSELEGRTALEFIHPDDLASAREEVAKIVRAGQTRTQYRMVHRDGTVLWVETIAVLLTDPVTGEPVEIQCSTRDISQQRAQTELVETTQRIAKLGGWELDLASGAMSWTRQLYEIHGADPSSPPPAAADLHAHLEPESLAFVLARFQELVREGTPWNAVLRGTTLQGRPLILRSTAEGVFRDGKVVGIRGTSLDITEQERVREEFEAVSRMTRAILDTSEALIVVLDRDGGVARFNHACEKATGWTEVEILGRPFFDVVIPPDERESVRRLFQNLQAGHFPNHHENHWIDRDGRLLWTAWANSAILGRNGRVDYVVAIGIDMTQHRKMQLELQESEARLRTMIDTAPDAVVIIDAATWNFADANPAAEALFRMSRPDLLALGPMDVSPRHQPSGSLSKQALSSYVAQVLQGGSPSFEWVHRRSDGSEVLCDVHLARLPSEDRTLVRGSITDISERRKTESVLESLVRGTSSVFGQAFFDTLVADLAQLLDVRYAFVGRVDPARESVRTLSFHASGKLAANVAYRLEGAPCADVYARSLLSVPRGLGARYAQAPLFAELGAESYMGVPLFSSSHEPIGVLVVADDRPMKESDLARSILTIFAGRAQGEIERLEAETTLRDLNLDLERRVQDRTSELRATNRELEAFSYSVSHDLRSPLRAIDGFAQAIQEDYAEAFDDAGRHFLGRIRSASHRMADLIDDLLSLSRSSRAEVHKTTVDLSAMAAEILANLARSEPGRVVSSILEPDLSAPADPTLIRAVLENLLGNSWKYSRFQEHPVIEFRTAPAPEGFAGFAVVDNGAGFDMAHAPKLFGTFQRLHKAEEFEGNGIGLATVRRILERHGGSISAEGEVGRGATFRFQLPLAASPAPTANPSPSKPQRD